MISRISFQWKNFNPHHYYNRVTILFPQREDLQSTDHTSSTLIFKSMSNWRPHSLQTPPFRQVSISSCIASQLFLWHYRCQLIFLNQISGPSPPNMLNEVIELLPPVLFDDLPAGKYFGEVETDANPEYQFVILIFL